MGENLASPFDGKEFLNRKECALYLSSIGIKMAAQTLANIAANNNQGNGPPLHRTRWTRTYYKRSEVDQWAKAQTERIE